METQFFYKQGFTYRFKLDGRTHQTFLETLMWYLSQELSTGNIDSALDRLKNRMYEGVVAGGGNVYSLGQLNALAVIDYLYWDDTEYEEYDDRLAISPYAFVTTKEHMLEILKQWQYAVNQDPKKIVFVQDNDGKVTITPEN